MTLTAHQAQGSNLRPSGYDEAGAESRDRIFPMLYQLS
jgi:hypothetical protein